MDDKQRIALVHTWTAHTYSGEFVPALDTPYVRYQYGNHLGSASLELSATAAIISYEEYFPYGETSFIADDNKTEVSLKEYRYTGKERDDSTSLYYYGARYYISWIGRWLSADPAGPVDGVNLYVYCSDNPIRKTDSTGMADDDPDAGVDLPGGVEEGEYQEQPQQGGDISQKEKKEEPKPTGKKKPDPQLIAVVRDDLNPVIDKELGVLPPQVDWFISVEGKLYKAQVELGGGGIVATYTDEGGVTSGAVFKTSGSNPIMAPIPGNDVYSGPASGYQLAKARAAWRVNAPAREAVIMSLGGSLSFAIAYSITGGDYEKAGQIAQLVSLLETSILVVSGAALSRKSGGGGEGQRIPAPKEIEAFPGLERVKPKTPIQGGGGLRKRWKDEKGRIYEWDSRHGTVEVYSKKGVHVGEFDPTTGKQLKPANPSRTVKP
jgi:RHS repeat-associated protein